MPEIDTKHLTFVDYLLLPTIVQRYDIIDGEMVMSPAPTVEHQWIIANMHLALAAYFRANPRGIVLFASCDIVIRRDPLRTRQPDLFIFLRGREDIGDLENLRRLPVLEIAPDITIEIISKSETRPSRTEKIEDYRRIGVKECWIVSPQGQTLEVLRLSAEGMQTAGLYGMGMRVQSELLPGLELRVDELFA
ncbi:MAG: Uma2 family endonuclease [Nitrospinae bacterium]|nr:Uma2 family endonuclease [Nitrospinota bacterium]